MSHQKTAPKLAKGQLLYREMQQRWRRFNEPIEREVEQVTIATVGSKYFTIEGEPDSRFLKDTLRDEYAHQPVLYRTSKEITDEWERADLQRDLRKVFDYQRVPLNELRQVAALLPEQLVQARKPLRPPS
jgi:hypothetical protein